MALVDGDDLVLRYDRRRIADLVGDAGVRVDPSTVETNPVVLAAIADAVDVLKSAVRVGSRYSATDLQDDPDSLVNDAGKPLVKRLVCNLAFGLLTARRGYAADEIAKLAPLYADSLQLLEQLRQGDRILDSDDAAAAGLPSHEEFRPLGAVTPSLLSDSHRYFGVNPTRYYPTGRY